MRERIGLVGCVKSKGSSPTTAQDLYTSRLFVGRRAWVEGSCTRWFILSAKHGLVAPSDHLEAYDLAMSHLSDAERREWSHRVLDQLRDRLGRLAGVHFEFHAGWEYRELGLRQGLERAGAETSYPMKGKNLGDQIAAYEGGTGSSTPARAAGVSADPARAREAARRLWSAWSTIGIFGHRDMPETILPEGVSRGSLEHACFITLTVALDYMRDAADLWASARATHDDLETRWVFDPPRVATVDSTSLAAALGRRGVARRPTQDTSIWRDIASSLADRFDADPRVIAERCGHRAPAMLAEIRRRDLGRGFPWLGGRKIGPLWIRMLADEVGLPLLELDRVPIPVDVHIARATWACGALSGTYQGPVEELVPQVADVWVSACVGQEFYPLQLDQALWLQSRDGCSQRTGLGCPREGECVLADLCVDGTISIVGGQMEAATEPTALGISRTTGGRQGLSGDAWALIVSLAGADGFVTATGLPVRYSMDDDAVVVEGRRNARIPRTHVELALANAPLRSVADVPQECWGRSYIFAILNDPRIRGVEL